MSGLDFWSEGRPAVGLFSRRPAEIAELQRHPRAAALVRASMRRQHIADLFALVIFLCDGPLRLRQTGLAARRRFFVIAAALPIELQRMLCHRAAGSAGQRVSHADSESAFRHLAGALPVRARGK